MIPALLFAAWLSTRAATAAEQPKPAPKASSIPYLGPGSDKLSPEEYERIYRTYIQTSVLLGYPVGRETPAPCDQALNTLFRQVGMYGYPVPGDAQHVVRTSKVIKNVKAETYELGGILIQVQRDAKTSGLQKLLLVNSSSARATRRLSQSARAELIDLDRDKITGLERVKGIPVGYPHPLLSKEGQGLFVKQLRFNGKVDGCEPVEFNDNNWTAGFALSDERCQELRGDAEHVWKGELSTDDFYEREVKRMKERAQKAAMKDGMKEADAKALVEKHVTLPLASEINVVGSAMQNLAQCNLVALGRAGRPKGGAEAVPAGGEKNGTTKGASSAE